MRTRTFLAPEVIQSSGMDCGPAALKTLLAGFGVEVGYDRLREACQTDVDGTSIDVLERLANEVGVPASQQMLPLDALLELAGQLAPFLLILKHDSGGLHFVTVWSRLGRHLQVMDPSVGRRWLQPALIERDVYLHNLPIDGQDWLEIISNGPFLGWLAGRITALGDANGRRTLDGIIQQRGWRGLCAADASARMVHWLLGSGEVKAGDAAARLFMQCLDLGLQEIETGQQLIPPAHWFARPLKPRSKSMVMRGAVMLVSTAALMPGVAAPPASKSETVQRLRESPLSPVQEVLRLFQARDLAPLGVLFGALVIGSLGTLAELMIFRASSSLIQRLGVLHQRLLAVGAFGVFLLVLLLLDYLVIATCYQLGRQLEGRLRVSLLMQIPRLEDSYFRSRLLSDMAQRAHMLYSFRSVPMVVQDLMRSLINLLVTLLAISLLFPTMALPTVAGSLVAILIPALASRWLFEQEDRVQQQQGAISRFYMDALAGIVPLRTHGAEQSLTIEHLKLLAEWSQSASERQRTLTVIASLQTFFGAVLSVSLVYLYLRQGNSPQGLLLLLFWIQRIPQLGQNITSGTTAMAPIRTSLVRVLEPLRMGREPEIEDHQPSNEQRLGIALRFAGINVVAGGQPILQNLNLQISPGEHIAIVGRSGAGKSSLLALLLGIHQPSSGALWLDEQPVSGRELFSRIRRELAWVDPGVQLWKDSLLNNIQYGSQDQEQHPIAHVIEQSDLLDVLDRLPEGFQTNLGEGGALVSGGEGQRVRLARALLRRGVRLALLDEPFRGLDRHKRRKLLNKVRELWGTATLLCVTHDVAETQEFDRVLVVEDGQVIEDDSPANLLARSSRYRQLLETDVHAHTGIWASQQWRHVVVRGGQVQASREEP